MNYSNDAVIMQLLNILRKLAQFYCNKIRLFPTVEIFAMILTFDSITADVRTTPVLTYSSYQTFFINSDKKVRH